MKCGPRTSRFEFRSSLPAGFKIVPVSPRRYNPRMKWLFKWAFRLVLLLVVLVIVLALSLDAIVKTVIERQYPRRNRPGRENRQMLRRNSVTGDGPR